MHTTRRSRKYRKEAYGHNKHRVRAADKKDPARWMRKWEVDDKGDTSFYPKDDFSGKENGFEGYSKNKKAMILRARRRIRLKAAADKALQLVEEFPSEQDANEALAAMQQQDGYLGGRVLEPGPGKPKWRLQVFFTDDTDGNIDWLPDGVRRVVIPKSMQHLVNKGDDTLASKRQARLQRRAEDDYAGDEKSEKNIRPEFWAVGMDVTKYYNIDPEDQPYIEMIEDVYVYDRNERTYLAESTPSRFLVYIDTNVICHDDTPDDLREELWEKYATPGDDSYMHVSDVERMKNQVKLPFDAEDIDEAVEYWRGNAPF